MFRQQPLRVAASIARDSVRLFALTRDGDPEVTNIARWQFQTFYPTYPRRYTLAVFTRLARQHGSGGDLVAVSRPPPCCATTSWTAATHPARCTRSAWPPGCSDRSAA